MHKEINSSRLANLVSEKLKLNQADSLKLYKELAQLPNGYVKDALHDLIVEKPAMSNYVACIKETHMRNAQYETADGSGVWQDVTRLPLLLGVVNATSYTDALKTAAASTGIDESVIKLYVI